MPDTGPSRATDYEFHPRPPGWKPVDSFDDGRPRCPAWSGRHGRQCNNSPIRGGRVCRAHGGSSPAVRAAAEARLAASTETEKARRAVTQLGLSRTVEPHQALLEELHQSAGLVAWLRTLLDQNDTVDVESATWRAWDIQRAHLVRVAKTCIDAGIAERQVQLAEAQGRLLVDVIRRIFDDPELGLTEEQRQVVGVVAGRHLRAVNA
jgi:hypothetical protein